MKEFLEYLVKNIVDEPTAVAVTENNEGGAVVLTLSVAPADMGKVIGKEGRIIHSIRDLVRILAIQQNLRVNVNLTEVNPL